MDQPLRRSSAQKGAAGDAHRRAQSVTDTFRSAKNSASLRSSTVFASMRSKAQDLAIAASRKASSAAAVAKDALGGSPNNASGDMSPEAVDKEKVREICNMGFSFAAARLALCRNGDDKAAACHWLLEEQNCDEIDSAEVAEIWAAGCSGSTGVHTAFANPEDYLFSEGLADLEGSFDDGRGLGMGRRCDGESCEADNVIEDAQQLCQDEDTEDMSKDEIVLNDDTMDQSCHSDVDMSAPLPPDSNFWDWPLSRHEKKERVLSLERELHTTDKQILMRELADLRVSWRTSTPVRRKSPCSSVNDSQVC